MTDLYYILDANDLPIPQPDIAKWSEWFAGHERYIALDTFGAISISTVFLGINHNHLHLWGSKPILWETMIFGGPHDQYQTRASSLQEAREQHAEALALVKSGIR